MFNCNNVKINYGKTSKAEFISAVKLVYDKSNLTEKLFATIFRELF